MPTVACLQTRLEPSAYVSLGNASTWRVEPIAGGVFDGGIKADIDRGDSCDPITPHRSATFYLSCSTNTSGTLDGVQFYEDKPCHYVFRASSSFFCPVQPDNFDPGWIFVIVFCSVFLAYFIIGSLVWRLVLRKDTWIVNQNFWEYVYVCVLDGVYLLFCCKRRHAGYDVL